MYKQATLEALAKLQDEQAEKAKREAEHRRCQLRMKIRREYLDFERFHAAKAQAMMTERTNDATQNAESASTGV